MSLFGNLFGRKNPPEDALERRQFDEEWIRALHRFGLVSGHGPIAMRLVHPDTHLVMFPHEGLGQTFGEWKSFKTGYDRRIVLFDLLFNGPGQMMNRWQTANCLVANRRPDEAFALLEQAPASETETKEHQAASARALWCLGRPAEALAHAKKALVADPNDVRLKTLYADVLHITGDSNAAHAIYDRQMATAPPSGSSSVREMFDALFALETGVVPSPVLALEIAENMTDPAQSEEFWLLCETEFYDSPFFRMHHAYHLMKIEETKRSFAKLYGLVQETPWLKEPSLNLAHYYEKLDPHGKMMPEFQAQLRQTIRTNGWTIEGMNEIKLRDE